MAPPPGWSRAPDHVRDVACFAGTATPTQRRRVPRRDQLPRLSLNGITATGGGYRLGLVGYVGGGFNNT
jgi:hypothetical protein